MAPQFVGDVSGFISALQNRLSARTQKGEVLAVPAQHEAMAREKSVIGGHLFSNVEAREAMDKVKQTFTAASLGADRGHIVGDQGAVKTKTFLPGLMNVLGHLTVIVTTVLGVLLAVYLFVLAFF